jgi:L-threonylcarbamoyladenylate synthase
MELLSSKKADIRRAAAALRAGLLVVFPTETVYGLGADAFNAAALARIFEVKKRPYFDPLIVHIAELSALPRVADIASLSGEALEKLEKLSAALWPGPLTLVLPKRAEVPDLATGGLNTVALRLPGHPLARELIRLSTGAVAAPSANLFGCLSPTRVEHVLSQLGDLVDYVIDGGRLRIGLESTVLDLSAMEPRILRPGGTPRETIEKIIGPVEISAEKEAGPLSPGQLKSHYAPRTPLFLHRPGEMQNFPYSPEAAYIFFKAPAPSHWPPARERPDRDYPSYPSGGKGPPADRAFNIRFLSESGNMAEAAANLFALLHELDRGNFTAIHAEEVPSGGLGRAINDRLFKARAAAKGPVPGSK